MKYTPDGRGNFAGYEGYGFRSLATFVEAANQLRAKRTSWQEACDSLASVNSVTTMLTTAILEAGRVSLDTKKAVQIVYDGSGDRPVGLEKQ
jgi:D-galacturonate reductase